MIAIALLSKLLLDSLEQVPVENWRMLCGADLAFEDDLSDIEPVAQEISEWPRVKAIPPTVRPSERWRILETMPRSRRSPKSSPILPRSGSDGR
jgi:hypothetical protein